MPSPRPLPRGVIFQTAGFLIKNSDLSKMVETPLSISLSLINSPKLEELYIQALCKERDTAKSNQNKTACLAFKSLKFYWPP